jgi:hypothetical protein
MREGEGRESGRVLPRLTAKKVELSEEGCGENSAPSVASKRRRQRSKNQDRDLVLDLSIQKESCVGLPVGHRPAYFAIRFAAAIAARTPDFSRIALILARVARWRLTVFPTHPRATLLTPGT